MKKRMITIGFSVLLGIFFSGTVFAQGAAGNGNGFAGQDTMRVVEENQQPGDIVNEITLPGNAYRSGVENAGPDQETEGQQIRVRNRERSREAQQEGVMDQVRERDRTMDQTRDQVMEQTRDQVMDQTRDQVMDQTRDQIRDQIRDEAMDPTGPQGGSQGHQQGNGNGSR